MEKEIRQESVPLASIAFKTASASVIDKNPFKSMSIWLNKLCKRVEPSFWLWKTIIIRSRTAWARFEYQINENIKEERYFCKTALTTSQLQPKRQKRQACSWWYPLHEKIKSSVKPGRNLIVFWVVNLVLM